MMREALLAAILVAFSLAGTADAQMARVVAQGPIAPGNCAMWVGAEEIADSGVAC